MSKSTLKISPDFKPVFRILQVEQRDVPGIDCAYLAMDTEEGVEVVWNEVQFSERKNYKAQEDKIRQVFESLTQLQHPNIVNFHKYWTDTHNDKPRVINYCNDRKSYLSFFPPQLVLFGLGRTSKWNSLGKKYNNDLKFHADKRKTAAIFPIHSFKIYLHATDYNGYIQNV